MREPFTATISALAVLALALTGCSHPPSDGRGQDGRGQGGAPLTTTSPPTSPPATETASPGVEAASEVCQTVDMAAHNQLIAMALAIGGEKKSDSVVRADAAKTYRDFADELLLVAPQAGGKLRRALMKWATASTAVAHHIAERKPRAGLVIDFGPTEKQWDGAQTTAEKLCGQDLPALDQ